MALCLGWLCLAGPASAGEDAPPVAVRATYATPTDRYPHDIMGRLEAHTDLVVALRPCPDCAGTEGTVAIRLPDALVFEDFAPRLIDLDLDGRPEIVVVESHQSKGSRLAVWEVVRVDGRDGLVRAAATAFIGRRFRWLAPIGAADFDGDGTVELAYVETPHLGKTLRIVGRDGARLRDLAAVEGVTNHAIGQESVQSRIETCAGRPVIFALDATGARIVSIRLVEGQAEVAVEGLAKVRGLLDGDAFCSR